MDRSRSGFGSGRRGRPRKGVLESAAARAFLSAGRCGDYSPVSRAKPALGVRRQGDRSVVAGFIASPGYPVMVRRSHALEVMPPTPLDQARSRGAFGPSPALTIVPLAKSVASCVRRAGEQTSRALRTQRLRWMRLNPAGPAVPGGAAPAAGSAVAAESGRGRRQFGREELDHFGLRRNPDPRPERRSWSAPSQQGSAWPGRRRRPSPARGTRLDGRALARYGPVEG